MPTGQGTLSRCALGVESTWGAGVAVTELIPFTSESIARTIAQLQSEYIDGYAGRRRMYNSIVSPAGGLEFEMIWDEITGGIIGLERLIKGSMGASARDGSNNLNKYYFAEDIAASYTIAFNKLVSVWEAQGCKINALIISGEAGQKLKGSVEILARNLLRTGDAGIVNAAAAITGISPTIVPQNVMFDDVVFRLGDQADALASGDRLKISSFNLGLGNKLSDHEHASVDATNVDSSLSMEFLRSGFRDVKLSITIPRYISDQILTWLNSKTALQADLKITSGSYQFNILLPNIKVAGDPAIPISGPELVKAAFNFVALRNAGTNTYMTFQDTTAIIDELAIEDKSARTAAA
jgi:hypothetical protein